MEKLSPKSGRTDIALPPGELSAFLAVAQYGGFRGAARALGQSPSSLSHAVASLEARLGIQLFQRTTRNVSLTEAGQRFSARVGPALEEIQNAIDELGDLGARPTGRIRINADASAMEQVLEPLVLAFMEAYPDVQIEITSDKKLIDIARDGFDCGIRVAELVPGEMIAVPIGPMQQHIVVASPSYLETAPLPNAPADLSDHRCLQMRMPNGSLYQWEFERHGEIIRVETQGTLVLDNSRLILMAALSGKGLAYVTRWSAEPFLTAGRLRSVLDLWTPPYPGLCLYYPRHRHQGAAMKAFVAFARGHSS